MKRAGGERLGFKNTPQGSFETCAEEGWPVENYLLLHASQHANPSRPDGQVHTHTPQVEWGADVLFLSVLATDLAWRGGLSFSSGLEVGHWSECRVELTTGQ